LEARAQAIQSCFRIEQRLEIGNIERAVLSHMPPANVCAEPLKRKPGSDVRLVIKVADHNFASRPQAFGQSQAKNANEGGSVHAEGNLVRFARVHKCRHALAGALNGGVHFDTAAVTSATLHISRNQVILYCVHRNLRHLRSGAVIEKDELLAVVQRRKLVLYLTTPSFPCRVMRCGPGFAPIETAR